jgi:superfamily II DNA or RNA helicase
MGQASDLHRMLAEAETELAELEKRRALILQRIEGLKRQSAFGTVVSFAPSLDRGPAVTNHSTQEEKVRLFRTLFRGREDVYPRRFESTRTGKSGYQPVCRNQWIRPLCRKPKVKCGECLNRDFLPVTDEVIRNHLLGVDPEARSPRDFTIGVYPILPDETCFFLAADFDGDNWARDAEAFLEACRSHHIPAALERSRSGNGGHAWIFFSSPVPVGLARQMGAFLITEAMDRRPEIGFDAYDRLFPSQDTIPKGGFGALIALPLQKRPREKGNSVFLDGNLEPHADQWAFLSSLRCMNVTEAEAVVSQGHRRGRVIGVRTVVTDEEEDEPWTGPPSRRREISIPGPLPQKVTMVLGNQIYIPKDALTPALKSRLMALAAFQNPEFYKAQAMRLPTFQIPRIISCSEDFPKHLGMPRGCLEDVQTLLRTLKIEPVLVDERFSGVPIDVRFHGALRPDQEPALQAMVGLETGVLSATTAFGKTVVAACLIAARKVNTLVLVHRRQLMDQWMDRLRTFLGLAPDQIGQIGGGKRRQTGIVDVAIIQSLVRKGVVDDVVGGYGHLVVDECHHITARSFEMVARQCKAKYVTGLSATVTRKDGHHPIIFMQCGPVRYRVHERQQAALRPFSHRVVLRKTPFRLSEPDGGKGEWTIQEIYGALLADGMRNTMIVQDVVSALSEGRSPVILTERKEHLALLADQLSPLVKHLFVLSGGMGQKERKGVVGGLSQIPDGKERVILSTGRYLGEGFDDARLDTLFLALPVSWRGVLAQYAGRLHRLHEMKKEVVIYDYADLHVPVLARMFERRRKGYQAIGYALDGRPLVESN